MKEKTTNDFDALRKEVEALPDFSDREQVLQDLRQLQAEIEHPIHLQCKKAEKPKSPPFSTKLAGFTRFFLAWFVILVIIVSVMGLLLPAPYLLEAFLATPLIAMLFAIRHYPGHQEGALRSSIIWTLALLFLAMLASVAWIWISAA